MRGQGVGEKQQRSHPLIAPVIAPLPAHSWASVRCVTASRLVAMNLQPGFSLMHSCGAQAWSRPKVGPIEVGGRGDGSRGTVCETVRETEARTLASCLLALR